MQHQLLMPSFTPELPKISLLMSTLIQPQTIDVVRRQFLKSQQAFDAHSAVFQSISDRLLARLEFLAVEPKRILDLGCRSGYQLAALAERYPQATIVGADPAPGAAPQLPSSWPSWLRREKSARHPRVACDPHQLPFADESFDLVISNLFLPWCQEPHRVFAEVSRVLGTGGAFMFTSAGPDTLIEYRRLWADLDSHLHVFGLIDMHDLGDSMMSSGFAAPVLDRDNLVIDYPSVAALQKELIALGATNIALGRRPGLMSGEVNQRLAAQAMGDKRCKVTLELVQGHGWKGELRTPNEPGADVTVSIDTLRGSWSPKTGRQR